jgi:hypothetical protein
VGPIPQDAQRAYCLDIYCEFLKRAGLPPTRCMSPLEWLCLKAWMDTGIPLRVVLRGFRDTKGTGHTLRYYEPSVRAAYATWRAALGPAA